MPGACINWNKFLPLVCTNGIKHSANDFETLFPDFIQNTFENDDTIHFAVRTVAHYSMRDWQTLRPAEIIFCPSLTIVGNESLFSNAPDIPLLLNIQKQICLQQP